MNPISLAVKGRSEALRVQLEALCRRFGPGAKLQRLAELRAELGTSPTTLNKVLGEMEAAGLVTRRHAVGIFVADDAALQSEHLALVCRPSFFQSANHSPLWDMLLELLGERARASGADFDSYFSRENDANQPLPRPLMREVERGNIGGVLGVGLPHAAALWLMERVPVVNLYGKGHVIVGTDSADAIHRCVAALKKRGCRRVGLWMAAQTMGDEAGTRTGLRHAFYDFRRALQAHELPLDTERVRDNINYLDLPPSQQPSSAEQGYSTAREFAQSDSMTRPDGIVALDDAFTRGALTALREAGARDALTLATTANAGSPTLMGEQNLILAEFDPAQIAATMWQQLQHLRDQTPNERPEDEGHLVPATLRLT